MKIFRNPPLVMSGLTLGLFALGNLLKLYHPSLRHLLSIIALLLYLFLILSILKNLSQALEQIKHPLIPFLCQVCCWQAISKLFLF